MSSTQSSNEMTNEDRTYVGQQRLTVAVERHALEGNDGSRVHTDGSRWNSVAANAGAGGMGGGCCSYVQLRLPESGLAQLNVGDKDY
jgi:hypothetical protein